jgi:hypothetical protein
MEYYHSKITCPVGSVGQEKYCNRARKKRTEGMPTAVGGVVQKVGKMLYVERMFRPAGAGDFY